MYTIETLTPPATEPVTIEELKAHLRLNDDSEDTLLEGFIKAAREFFEAYTGRAVHETTFRQHIPYLTGRVYLMKAKLKTIEGFFYWNKDNQLTEIEDYYEDVTSIPGSVWLSSYPITSPNKTPNAYVDFVAGWEPDEVPEMAKMGIKLLASHYYENRNSHSPEELKVVPMGFKAVCDQFKTGLVGHWGQQ